MEVAPAARVQRSRVTEETFGVAPGWGRDGLYVGRAAKKGVVLAARGRGQRMSVTEETLGAVSASRGAGGAETPCTSEGLQKCSLRPLNGGSARA